MNANFLHPSARKHDTAAVLVPDDIASAAERPADPVGHACCCTARPVVQVTVLPTPARPHPTDLLLYGHHYRASRHALTVAHASIRELPGTSADIASWIGIDSARQVSPAH
jgi:hypothetical protein